MPRDAAAGAARHDTPRPNAPPDSRIAAVRELAVARQRTTDLQEALASGQRADDEAYAAALRAGWTQEELKKLNFNGPTSKPARTRRPPAPRTEPGTNSQ